ncbi:MAG: hypothetical protein RL310_622 [Actinomycetota bacterium]
MYSRDLSIVIPVFNSANCIVELVTEIVNEFSKHEFSYEIILVDVSDDTDAATFTFKGAAKSTMPDTPGDLAEATN